MPPHSPTHIRVHYVAPSRACLWQGCKATHLPVQATGEWHAFITKALIRVLSAKVKAYEIFISPTLCDSHLQDLKLPVSHAHLCTAERQAHESVFILRLQYVAGLTVASGPLGVIWAVEDEIWGQHWLT